MRGIDRPDRLADHIGRTAARALRNEAAVAPKPGLVDPFHSGAHGDMDFALMRASANALEGCFTACASAGLEFAHGGNAAAEVSALLPALRPIGLAGEKAMYAATDGVNTHKGAIFCLGLLAAAAGIAFRRRAGRQVRGAAAPGEEVCLLAGAICAGLTAREPILSRPHDFRGARGQAEDGYPILRRAVLPRLVAVRGQAPEKVNVARIDALLACMAELEDSCVLSRGGPVGLAWLRREAGTLLADGGVGTVAGRDALLRFDRELCSRGLSPGGSADMLAAGIFLDQLDDSRPGFLSL